MAGRRCPLAQPGAQEKKRGVQVTQGASIESDGRTSKLLGLELVRFACAMTVLIWHYQHFAMVGGGGAAQRPHEPLGLLLWPLYHFGLFGVQIFWCISGFIFYWKYSDAIAARLVEPKRFFWLRFSRLYPLHFATLLIVAALQPIHVALAGEPFVYQDNGIGNFLRQLALADQWVGPRDYSFNGPIWSVSAEVSVYVLFFMLLRNFGKSRLLILAAIALSLNSLWSGHTSPTLICGGYFFAGGAAAEWMKSARAQSRPREAIVLALAWIAAMAAVAVVTGLDRTSPITPTWLMAICPPLLFLAARDLPALNRWQAPIQAAGNLTYSTYLIHFPLQLTIAIAALAGGFALPLDQPWFLLAYLAATIILGRIVFVRFEAPVQKLIRAATLTRRSERAAA
jgi:peptidoglycan/LPS O-acetylase OafA/YrhL